MIIETFVCGRARSNAYLFAHADRCVIVDAGPGSAERISRRVAELDLTPSALLLTHGHPDHIWCAREISSAYGIPAYVHTADLGWFADPASGGHAPLVRLGGRLVGALRRLRPPDLRPIEEAPDIQVLHTPGHTPGSTLLLADDVCFSGDTIFASSVGRTSYPGGSATAMRTSLRACLEISDDVRLLPGHGPQTTMRNARPFLENVVSAP